MVKQQLLQAGDILMTTRVLSWLSFASSAYATQLHQGQHDALYALGRISLVLPVWDLLCLE